MSTEPWSEQGPRGRYRLASNTSLRREPFGGIAYSHVTRRLQVIESRLALEVAVRLSAGETVAGVVAWLARGDADRQSAAERQVAVAVEGLLSAGILVETPAAVDEAATKSSGVLE